jgi:hypothetical protein
VTITFTPTVSFTSATLPDITIRTRNAADILINLTSASPSAIVPVIVMSHGKNGYGATNDQGISQALPATWPTNNADENTNASGTTVFISRSVQSQGASGSGGEFDDQLIWISRWVLMNRMVAAGKLP